MDLILVSNWVWTMLANSGIKNWVLDLFLSKYTQVHRVKSSTRVKKYLKPSTIQVEKEPHRSQCTSPKGLWETCVLIEKGSLFCLENWQTSQQSDLFATSEATILFSKAIFEKEGWPNLVCHKVEADEE